MDNTRKITKLEKTALMPVKRKRVAAYARVSSGKDAQLHSLSVQISYYNEYIGNRGDWQLVKIYADEAMTGTRDDRPQFQQLLADCRAGKIDMVITKSVTRLARNTLTVLNTARELKSLGIDIYFEKENIHTISSDGELMLTLLATFAQEESLSASENVKWRIRKKFEQGYSTYIDMYGYRFRDNILQIVPEEAQVVRQVFEDYLSGIGKSSIARKLNRQKIPTKSGSLWRGTTIHDMLTNEKYTGSLLLQKTYRLDHISKKTVRNHGEVAQYFVAESHEAIIDRSIFAQVQKEIKRRAEKASPSQISSGHYLFTGLVLCGQCGKRFFRKIRNRNTKYAKPVWSCSLFDTLGKEACPAKQIPENILIAKTTEMLGTADWERERLLQEVKLIKALEDNTLVYIFQDGHFGETRWQNPSRRESWTEEMKQKAREKSLANAERRHKNGNKEQKSPQD